MPPPMSSRSTLPSRLSMTPSLSETLEPPSTTTYGRSGSSVSRRSTSTSAAPGRPRVRQPLRHVVHAGVLAVHGAEAVADVRVGERGELVGERAALGVVLAGLARVEAEVLQQRDLAVAEATPRCGRAPRRRCRWRTRRRRRAARRAAWRPGPASSAGSGAPLGRPRCAATTTRAPASSRVRIVGTLARIRPSSVIRSPSSGTLRSERTSTRLPRRSPRSSSCFIGLLRRIRLRPDRSERTGRRRIGFARGQSEAPTSVTRSTRRLE